MEQGAEVCACLTPLVYNRKTLGFTTQHPCATPLFYNPKPLSITTCSCTRWAARVFRRSWGMTFTMSRNTRCASHVMRHTSHFTRHTSHVITRHTSHVTGSTPKYRRRWCRRIPRGAKTPNPKPQPPTPNPQPPTPNPQPPTPNPPPQERCDTARVCGASEGNYIATLRGAIKVCCIACVCVCIL